jgi:hypothetical protein
MRGEVLPDAIGPWEPHPLWYDVALTALAAAWVVVTWLHFRPALNLASLLELIALAAVANVC